MNISIIKCGIFMGLLKHPNLPFSLPKPFSITMPALDNLLPKYCSLSSFSPFGYSFVKNGRKRYAWSPKLKMEAFISPLTIAFRKMEQVYFAIFGLSLTGKIFLSHKRSPATSPLKTKSNNGNRKGFEH